MLYDGIHNSSPALSKMKRQRAKMLFTLLALLACSINASGVSFDVSKSSLDYGEVSPGSFSSMSLNLYVRGDKTMVCTLSAEGEIKDWVKMNESRVLLQPYTAQAVHVDLRIPEDAAHKSYSSNVYFSVSEYSPSGAGMGVTAVLRMPVAVAFDVLGSGSKGVYTIQQADMASNTKKIVLKESNTGSRILFLDYNISISDKKGDTKTLAKKDKIRPYSTRNLEIDLSPLNLAEGKYTAQILVTSNEKEYANLKLDFTLSTISIETTPTTIILLTTTTLGTDATIPTVTTIPEKTGDTKNRTYMLAAILILINIACITYILHSRKQRKPRQGGLSNLP